MDIEKYFWNCPNCNNKVNALKQLVNSCFFDDGEAQFATEENCGLWFHTIFCPKCEARWTMSISGMELENENIKQQGETK